MSTNRNIAPQGQPGAGVAGHAAPAQIFFRRYGEGIESFEMNLCARDCADDLADAEPYERSGAFQKLPRGVRIAAIRGGFELRADLKFFQERVAEQAAPWFEAQS